MIPNINILIDEITETTFPNRTYKIDLNSDRISGYVDDIDAITQAIYLILSTERYHYNIYSWDYGIELVDLYGKPIPYVMSELPRRIKEALTQDDRITDVTDFEFEKMGTLLQVTFVAVSEVAKIPTVLEVEI